MLDTLRGKIRALVGDFSSSSFEVFEYTTSSLFTLAESNIENITSVTKNGSSLGSGEYDYDSINNEIDITVALVSKDIIIVKYTFYKYSDTELNEYIRASLVWVSIFSYCSEMDFELETDYIYPTPSNQQQDLIAIIASILIKPNYSEYNLPNLKVKYPRNIDKEEKIRRIIQSFQQGIGIISVLEYD